MIAEISPAVKHKCHIFVRLCFVLFHKSLGLFRRFGKKARPTARAKLRLIRSSAGPQLFRHKSSALFPPEAPSLQAPSLSSTAEICLPADLRYPLSAISLATKIPLAEAWEREWVTPLPSPIT